MAPHSWQIESQQLTDALTQLLVSAFQKLGPTISHRTEQVQLLRLGRQVRHNSWQVRLVRQAFFVPEPQAKATKLPTPVPFRP